MEQAILDHTLHSYLQRVISELPINQKLQLKSIGLCGSRVAPQKGLPNNVYVLSNGKVSKFVGQTMCKNTWACPVCSAYMMSKYAAEIADSIEVKRAEGYLAFMVTLSVPHLRFMTCRQVTDILYKTYDYFRRTAKQKNYRKQARTGTVSKQFYDAFKIDDYVTVCEYTWGINGWHPHFHMLLWTKKENADKILAWQEKLNEFWLYTAKRITEKCFKEFFTEEFAVEYVNKLYEKSEKGAGLYISNDNGKLRESLTSDYVSGWGADKELTGNRRKEATHEGHLTPYQILEKAYYGDKKMEDLYIEYCLQVTRKPVHHRVCWSKNGFKARVKNKIQALRGMEYLKKKESENREWKVVCYFTSEQWSTICYNDRFEPLKANILYMAIHAPDLIPTYLENHDIFIKPLNETCQLVEDLFNQAV